MPYKDIEKKRASRMKSYYKNRDKELNRQKEYDKIRNQTDERKNYQKEYYETNPQSCKISSWKYQGMILKENEDWESIYIEYLITENCENCNCILTKDKVNTSTMKCLDHDHETGFIRGIICQSCNVRDK